MRLRANRLPSVAEGIDLALGMSALGGGGSAHTSPRSDASGTPHSERRRTAAARGMRKPQIAAGALFTVHISCRSTKSGLRRCAKTLSPELGKPQAPPRLISHRRWDRAITRPVPPAVSDRHDPWRPEEERKREPGPPQCNADHELSMRLSTLSTTAAEAASRRPRREGLHGQRPPAASVTGVSSAPCPIHAPNVREWGEQPCGP